MRKATTIRLIVILGAVAALEAACRLGWIKRFTMIRPYILTNGGTPGLQASINVDFEDSYPYGAASLTPTPSTSDITTRWLTTPWEDS